MDTASWTPLTACTSCGAASGKPCRTGGGQISQAPHAGRGVDRSATVTVNAAVPPAVAAAASPQMTRQRRDILAAYFRGSSTEVIAKFAGCRTSTVVAVIESIAYSKPRARELVLAYDHARLNPLRATVPAPPPGTYATPALPTVEIKSARAPQVVVTRIPAIAADRRTLTLKESTMDDTKLMSTDTLLKTAETSGVPKAERLAKQIRGKLDDLAKLMEGSAEQRRLAAEIAVLQKHLAERKAELAAASGKTLKNTTAAAAGKRDTKAIRAWALAKGITCPGHGRIPGYVLDAYDKAHQDA